MPEDTTTEVSVKPTRPDAVTIPWATIATALDPRSGLVTMARRCSDLLQCDKTKGEKAYVRNQPELGFRFATRSIGDSIYFASTHPRTRQPRYRWEPQADGVRFGYLVDGAIEGGETDA